MYSIYYKENKSQLIHILQFLTVRSFLGSSITGTPVMFVMCLTYSLLVLGPWALVGNIVILLFYPIMVSNALHVTNVKNYMAFLVVKIVVKTIQDKAMLNLL